MEISTGRDIWDVIYQELDDLISAVQFDGSDAQAFDTSCFSGEYVTGDVTSNYLEFIERKRNDAAKAKKEIGWLLYYGELMTIIKSAWNWHKDFEGSKI